ncbi:MAG: SDR family oxidoreductase [Desulfobacteraceae bacterium]|nr:MAG: SDR family oxidoreductase [Desulfobacteraceae bacterium]
MTLSSKVALVLGAVKGIGKGIGLALAAENASLALTRHDWTDSFQSMEEDFKASGARHEIYTADLRDIEQVKALARDIERDFGRLDILVNNIERGGWPAVHGEYTQEQWDLEMETTLRAKRWVFHHMLPLLRKSRDASVINISSIAAAVGRSGPAAVVFNDGYAAACAGVSSLTRTWARMGAPHIRVNELMLGIFETRHAQGTRGWKEALSDKEKQALIDHTLLKRTGTVEDAAKAVLFMVRGAPYMTGSTLCIDGGYLLGGQTVPDMPEGILGPHS